MEGCREPRKACGSGPRRRHWPKMRHWQSLAVGARRVAADTESPHGAAACAPTRCSAERNTRAPALALSSAPSATAMSAPADADASLAQSDIPLDASAGAAGDASAAAASSSAAQPPPLLAEDTAARALYVPITYGNISTCLGKKQGSGETMFKWTCYVRSPDGVDLSAFISRVVFTLHPTFMVPVRGASSRSCTALRAHVRRSPRPPGAHVAAAAVLNSPAAPLLLALARAPAALPAQRSRARRSRRPSWAGACLTLAFKLCCTTPPPRRSASCTSERAARAKIAPCAPAAAAACSTCAAACSLSLSVRSPPRPG